MSEETYKEGYLVLFNAMTDAIEEMENTIAELKKVQVQCEDNFISVDDIRAIKKSPSDGNSESDKGNNHTFILSEL